MFFSTINNGLRKISEMCTYNGKSRLENKLSYYESLFLFRGDFAACSSSDLQDHWRNPWLLHFVWGHTRTSGAGVPRGNIFNLVLKRSLIYFKYFKNFANIWSYLFLLSSSLAGLWFLPIGPWASNFLGGTTGASLKSRPHWRGTSLSASHM